MRSCDAPAHAAFSGFRSRPSGAAVGVRLSFQAAFNLEVAAHDAPLIDTAVTLAAQPLLAWGSPEQQAFFLPRIIAGELIVCIAYTEPDAGSDLGNLSMVAEPDGDGFVLTGVKSLVTAAHKADWCLTIARTRPGVPPREGLTMFLLDMKAEGLNVRRRATMNRWTLGEIACDGVRVGSRRRAGRGERGLAATRRRGGHRGCRNVPHRIRPSSVRHVGGVRHVGARRRAVVRRSDHPGPHRLAAR